MTGKGGRLATWRSRLPVVAVVVACVAGVVAAVTGAANPVSAVQFLMPGHWVYNSALQSVFHVDGSTGNVDARANVPGGPGDQVFQGDKSGYVVGSSRITEFGKSSLEVADTTAPPSRAKPVGVETAGGPYLVYQEDGQIVRLGDPSAVLSLGGPVGVPVATHDGTLWLPRTEAGFLCRLPKDANSVACPVGLPKNHKGALSVVGERLVFVDTTADTVHVVGKDGLGDGHELGVDAADDVRLASTDVGGRLAILDGERMHLVDAGLDGELDEPVTVDLGNGDYSGPVSTGSVVAVVNQTTGTLVTFDADGGNRQAKKLPAEKGEPRLTRGEDNRIYVDGDEGSHVVVVDRDGGFTDVPISEDSGKGKKARPTGGSDPDAKVSVPPKPADDEKPKQDPPPKQEEQEKQEEPQNPPEQEEEPPPPPPEVPATPPGAPTGVSATAGNASATVNWGAAPANRSAITSYRITWAGGSTTAGPNARTLRITGLANGTTYSFAVTAVNGVGTGPAAASNPVTPVAPVRPASAPTNVQVDWDPATRTAVMTWAPPTDYGGGSPGGYYVTGEGWGESSVGGTTWTFDNIQATGTLTFTVRARTTDSAGRLVEGATATATVEAGAIGTVTVTRGTPTEEYCGEYDACAWMAVTLDGLQPNTTYEIIPHSSDPEYGNEGAGVTTDENGDYFTERFAYAGVGHTVWITARSDADNSVVRSNDYVWEAG